jgi:hypothetical protein
MAKRRLTGKPDPQQPEKPVKLTLQLSPDLARRFGVHAEMMGLSKSDLFAELVKAGCKRFIVSDRQGGTDEAADPVA